MLKGSARTKRDGDTSVLAIPLREISMREQGIGSIDVEPFKLKSKP